MSPSRTSFSTKRVETACRLLCLLPLVLTTACTPKGLQPALRDDIVFDAPRYQAFMTSMSVNVDAAWFVDRARWQTASAPPPIQAVAQSRDRGRHSDGSYQAMIADVAEDQGVDPAYMVGLARRESGFDSAAHARTSSAGGLFQFTRDTWLCNLRLYGAQLGVGGADAIVRGGDGRCSVTNPADRFYLLSLRFNASLSTQIAARHTLQNQRILETLGRMPSHADLYALHFLGPSDGRLFLSAPADALGYEVTPRAAHANPAVFWHHGRPLQVWEIYRDFGAL